MEDPGSTAQLTHELLIFVFRPRPLHSPAANLKFLSDVRLFLVRGADSQQGEGKRH